MENIKAFASYRLPGEKDFYTVLSNQYPIIEKEINFLSEKKFYVSSFDGKTIASINTEEVLKNEFINCNISFNNSPKPTKRYEFIKQVKLAIKKIKALEFDKVVLSKVRTVKKPANFDWKTLFKNLMNHYPDAFVYTFYSELTGFWVGATPELFLDKDINGYHTVSLAGTKKKEDEWTQKEKEEQLFVTSFITNNLREKARKLDVSAVHDTEIGSIKHLETTIDFDLYLDQEINKIISTLNPTPAVCGFPKDKAFDFIQHIEEHDRSLYTGLIGPIGLNGASDLFVNLRCMQVCIDELVLYTGGGITKDSNPKDEWNETEEKAKVLNNLL